MTELKTLKDLEIAGHEVVRQEAINHIKNCNNPEDFSTHNKCGFYYDEEKKYPKTIAVFCEICEWIMYFFNITEEDLKND